MPKNAKEKPAFFTSNRFIISKGLLRKRHTHQVVLQIHQINGKISESFTGESVCGLFELLVGVSSPLDKFTLSLSLSETVVLGLFLPGGPIKF